MMQLLFPRQCLVCNLQGSEELCPRCAPFGLHRVPSPAPTIRGVLATARYGDPISGAVRRAKYGGDRARAARLAEAWARHIVQIDPLDHFDAIVPAPSPVWRRAHRGFSLPALLARALARRCAAKRVHALWDHGGTMQASLNTDAERAANLVGRIRSLRAAPGRILLVDDVITTGSTVRACADELLGDETQEVWVVAVCVATRRKIRTDVQNL